MRVGIPKETLEGERRVAATPSTIEKLKKQGFEVRVEAGCGALANFPDGTYEAAGAEVVADRAALWGGSDVLLKVNPPTEAEVDLLREGATLISFLWPDQNEALVEKLRARNVTALAMDKVPRITRAQKMDALSSMANIAGYRAVVEAAAHFGSFFTGQITAAGRVPPARVLIIGAGVAGLAAIGAARGLGAIVRAFDTRESVKEQVQSLGAEFLELEFEESGEGAGGYAKVMSKAFIEAEMALFREQAKEVDIVITTALIPGRKAPILWDAGMVEAMKDGSVVVDLAASQGGNCELTQPGEVVVEHGVTLIGYTDLTSRLPTTASQLYGTNLTHFLDDLGKAEGWNVDLEDEVIRGALVTHEGEVMWPPPKREDKPKEPPKPAKAEAPKAPVKAAEPAPEPAAEAKAAKVPVAALIGLALAGLWLWLKFDSGSARADHALRDFVQHLTVFVLACFVGWQVIWNVTPALHTPLMSVTNAISGIIIIGGLIAGTQLPLGAPEVVLGATAVLFAMINVSGGFLVTQRMLKMFRKE